MAAPHESRDRPENAATVERRYRRRHGKAPAVPDSITRREEEILLYMVAGHDAKRIASLLDISNHTVRKHIANIYLKLHVRSRAEIISMAHHNKWFGK